MNNDALIHRNLKKKTPNIRADETCTHTYDANTKKSWPRCDSTLPAPSRSSQARIQPTPVAMQRRLLDERARARGGL